MDFVMNCLLITELPLATLYWLPISCQYYTVYTQDVINQNTIIMSYRIISTIAFQVETVSPKMTTQNDIILN